MLDCPCDGRDGSVPANQDNNDFMDDSDSDDEMDTRKGFVVASEINPGDLEKMDRAVWVPIFDLSTFDINLYI